eukprot:scaffold1539_cov22-Tisochrysis_lutea.AAC.1
MQINVRPQAGKLACIHGSGRCRSAVPCQYPGAVNCWFCGKECIAYIWEYELCVLDPWTASRGVQGVAMGKGLSQDV